MCRYIPGCTVQIKSMVVRPGCVAELWYGFDYSGFKRTYEAGIYHNVGPVEDPNVSNYLDIVIYFYLPP